MASVPEVLSSCTAVEKPRRKRVLDDKACEVCHDKSTGKHYGVYVCDGCSGFFKRSVRRSIPWVCRSNEKCVVDKASRTECRACRFKKCLTVNMNPEGVQTPRGSRMVHERKSTESDSDSNYSLSGDLSPSSEMRESLALHDGNREHLRHDKDQLNTRAKFPKSDMPSLSPTKFASPLHRNSPPLSMAMQLPALGGKLQNETISPTIAIKIETERRDVPGNDVTLDVTLDVDEDLANDTDRNRSPLNNAKLVAEQQNNVGTTQSPRSQIVPFPRRRTEYYGGPHPMIIPDSSFSPYASPGFPTNSSIPCYISTDQHVHSSSGTPVALPYPHGESLYSMAVRLLSRAVKFAKNIPSFKLLAFRDQVILLEENWKDLFILDAAFWSFPLELSYVIDPVEAKKETNAKLVGNLRVLQELVTRIQALEMDKAECGYLKTIVIFKPDIKGLKDSRQVEKLQDDTQVKFAEYVRAKTVDNPARFGRLLLTLLGFERVSQEVIEKLFFRSKNENISVEYILHDMFKST